MERAADYIFWAFLGSAVWFFLISVPALTLRRREGGSLLRFALMVLAIMPGLLFPTMVAGFIVVLLGWMLPDSFMAASTTTALVIAGMTTLAPYALTLTIVATLVFALARWRGTQRQANRWQKR